MISEQDALIELHDELMRQIVEKRLEIDAAHLWEPLKKQDKLCLELMNIEEKLSLLDRRIEANKNLEKLRNYKNK